MYPIFKLQHLFIIVSALFLLTVQGCAQQTTKQADSKHYKVTEKIVIGGAGGWDFIAFDQVRQRLFITRGDRVQVWNTQSKVLVTEIPETAGVHGVAFAQDMGLGFTSNGRANTITVFHLDNLQVLKTISIPGQNPDAIIYDSKFKRIYSFNGKSKDVTVIDAQSLVVVTTIALGGKPEVGVSDGAGKVFVNIEDTAEIVAIDQATNTVQSRWSLSPCSSPSGLAIDADHHRLFSVCENNKMVVSDAQNGRQVAVMPIGDKPDGAAFDPELGLAFSSNGGGTLTLVHEIDPEHFEVAGNVKTQNKARTLTLDPITHKVYLVTALQGPAPQSTDGMPARPVTLPNSFSILIATPN